MFDLEPAITEWRRQLAGEGLKNSAALDELEGHLRDDVAYRIRSGLGAEQAYASAVRQLGGVNVLKAEFAKAARQRRRKYTVRALVFGAGFFLFGALFGRIALAPSMLAANEKYLQWGGFQISGEVESGVYRHFVNKLMLGTGLAFEIPLVILILVKIGVLNVRRLSIARRYVIVANLILAALFTTPEVLTQILMFLPLQVLFELTVCIARYWERRERKNETAAG